MDYSPDVIANLSKEGKIKEAETSVGRNAIYRAVKARKYMGKDILKSKTIIHIHKQKKEAKEKKRYQ